MKYNSLRKGQYNFQDPIVSQRLNEKVTKLVATFPSFAKESDVIQEAAKRGIADYVTAGKYGNNSETHLTRYGHALNREIERTTTLIQKTYSAKSHYILPLESPPVNPDPEIYSVVNLKVDSEAAVLIPTQIHMVVAAGNTDEDKDIKGIGYLTSASGTKIGLNGIAGPENPKLSNTQPISGENKAQYIMPLIPPIQIQPDEYEISEKGSEYVQDPDIENKLDIIKEQVEQYKSVAYKPSGITIEKLNELNNFHETITAKNETKEEVD